METLSMISMILCLIVLATVPVALSQTYNVLDYGAKGDGKTDCTKAFLSAWEEACAFDGMGTMVIPAGNFFTGALIFKGPCNGTTVFQLTGTMLATTNLNAYPADGWVAFQYLSNLKVTGKGVFDGQGAASWPHNQCPKNFKCKVQPTSIKFSYLNDSSIEGISSLNSKMFHMLVYRSNNVKLQHIKITAPDLSPNTDGIHIGESSNILINDAKIGTGDDCVSIGPGTVGLEVSKVTCGPGHGISIGSLGRYDTETDVEDIYIHDCTISGTTNGVRIKTWEESKPLNARNITYDNIIMNNVSNPIIVDQEYCPMGNCNGKAPSLVKITNVKFKNIRGTSFTSDAVILRCSKAVPCTGVELSNINLKYAGLNATAEAVTNCVNAQGLSSGPVFPPTCL